MMVCEIVTEFNLFIHTKTEGGKQPAIYIKLRHYQDNLAGRRNSLVDVAQTLGLRELNKTSDFVKGTI